MISATDKIEELGVTVYDTAPTGVRRYGYDAIESKGQRRPPKTKTMAEDDFLDHRKRRSMGATNRDVIRNFILASWMCRKHLDYVSCFSFRPRHPDEGFRNALSQFIEEKSDRFNFDIAARHPRRRMLRMSEGRRVIDGDFGWLKIDSETNRGKIQGVEFDRITSAVELPRQYKNIDWINGVETTPAGRTKRYCLAKRCKKHSLEFARVIPASSMWLHAYHDSTLRLDQVRGVSPFAAALNTMQDTHEGFSYSLARIKVAQMFGLTIYRNSPDPMGPVTPTEDTDDDGEPDSKYDIDLGRGPFVTELEGDDRAEFLENKTPAIETTKFLELMILVALKSLDIPYSFWNESFTNFYGSRGGLIQFLKSAKTKISDNRDLLDEWTRWRMGLAVFHSEFDLPSGMEFSDIQWEWVPDGVPWWDPVKEATGKGLAIAMGLETFDKATRESGGGTGDIMENLRENAKVYQAARELGVPLSLPGLSAETIQMMIAEAIGDGDDDQTEIE